MLKILFAIIESGLAFFQVLIERMFIHTTRSIEPGPGKEPVDHDANDMSSAA